MDDRTLAQQKTTRVRYLKTRVHVVKGPDAGLSLELASHAIRIGTASDNDLVLTDQTVSRRHCALVPIPEGIRITDEGSTNGVLVGEVRLFDAVLHGPQRFSVGESVLALEPLDESVEREQTTSDHFFDLLGSSARMRELFADLERIARSDISVLIEGETGTGKELVAESIHAASARAEQPFVVFDCSSVAATLAESELFGHERGAFTGAVATRPGVFEQAQGGSIFLDELGELPRDLQPKLLRVLEKREVRRLGSQRVIPLDVRVLAATHRNLAAEVARGQFREDLFFRVAAAQVSVPPLRDRMEDLPRLMAHFLSRAVPPRELAELAPDVWAMFRAHRWPGNVRELRNAVERLLVTPERALRVPILTESSSRARRTTDGAKPPASSSAVHAPLREARREASDAFELQYLESVLERAGGNVTRAAAIAEVSRQMIQKLMRKHGIA